MLFSPVYFLYFYAAFQLWNCGEYTVHNLSLNSISPLLREVAPLDDQDPALDPLGDAGGGVHRVAPLVVEAAPVLDLGVAADDAQEVVIVCAEFKKKRLLYGDSKVGVYGMKFVLLT